MFRTVGDQRVVVGVGPAGGVAAAAGGVGAGRCAVGRSGVLRPVRAVLRPADRSAVDADGDLSAVDVLEVPLPAGLRVAVPGGDRLDHLAAVLPDPAGRGGAASDDVDEADHPLRVGGGGRAERGAAGQGRRGEAVAHQPGPGRHHGGAGQRGLPDRLGAAGQGDPPDRGDRAADPGRRRCGPHQGCGTGPGRPGKRAHAIAAKLRSRTPPGRDEAQAAVRRITGELADLAETAASDAERLLANAKRALRRAQGQGRRAAPTRRARRGRGAPARPAGPRGQRPDRAAGGDPADRRRRPGSGSPGITPDGATRRVSLHDRDARPIAKGRLGQTGRVRAQGAGRRQRRRHRRSITPSSRATPPTRRNWPRPCSGSTSGPAATRAPSPPTAATAKPSVDHAPHRPRRPQRGDPPQRQTRPKPGEPRNTDQRSDEPSSGEPAAKAGSAPSNAATAGTAPASTAPKEPGSGPDTASWPTTWSRSAPWPPDREPHRPLNASCQSDGHPQRTSADPAPSLFQVEDVGWMWAFTAARRREISVVVDELCFSIFGRNHLLAITSMR